MTTVTTKSSDAERPLGASGDRITVQHGNAPPPDGSKTTSWRAIFTLKRADGVEKEIRFEEDEPGWILIKGTGISNGQCTPALDEHDRFDYNERNRNAWDKRMWVWLKKQMEEFSDGKSVAAFYINPYISIGGYFPHA